MRLKRSLPGKLRGISSAGQSACLARRRSRVRLPYSPQVQALRYGFNW